MTVRQTRAERAASPLARDAIRKIAEASGGCLRPVQLRRTDAQTREMVSVMVPCGATLASICPPCAERAKTLRAAQCREGWHLEHEPDLTPAAPAETQEFWLTMRAEAQLRRDTAAARGEDTTDLDELMGELDVEVTRAGIRGTVTTSQTGRDGKQRIRRSRSTRRRQDAAPLPARKIAPRTVGNVYTAPDGRHYRPSMFLTLTSDSYGKVTDDGTPIDPATYDYVRAARDAIHFSALFDRFIQNMRRVLGYEAQYFGGVEPQKRLAPHVHLAVRGSVPRPLLRQVLAATYHQVWWPATDTVIFDRDHLPVWDESFGNYLDPATGEVLQTWEEALDAIGPHDQPRHVARFGPKFDAQGVLGGSKDANKCIGYLTKYLTKQVAECHVQPKNARPGLIPGGCKGKAHRPEHCGYAGRRVLVSRKWSGKTLADHRADRKAWLVETLGLEVPDPGRYSWAQVTPADPDYLPPEQRLLHVVAERARWKAALDEARRRSGPPGGELPATGEAA